MDLMDTLLKEKKGLMKKIEKAAKEGDSSAVLVICEKLSRVEMLISRYEKIVYDIGSIGEGMESLEPVVSEKESKGEGKSRNAKSPREHGREIRRNFVDKLAKLGIRLRQVRGETIYQNEVGGKVGIAIATERQPDRWFLGLPDKGFDHAILLCERGSGQVLEVLLPDSFFAEYGKAMSTSKGQVKFNVARMGQVITVKVPGHGGVNASDYAKDYSFLA